MSQSLIHIIDKSRVPSHIAIIMDGNGRWAKEKGEERLYGHTIGVSSVKTVAEICAEIGVKYLTLYTFSKENWSRPQNEVDGLMELVVSTIREQIDDLEKNNVRFSVIGDLANMPSAPKQELEYAIAKLANNNGLNLILALNYSSRWEIQNAIKNIAADLQHGTLSTDDIDEELMSRYLTTHSIPDPELMIRTGGEQRISNFLLYQLAYAELYFTDTLWPDFNKEDLMKAVIDYQHRERRFGKTSEQIKNN